mgnify:CR=1 FL=1
MFQSKVGSYLEEFLDRLQLMPLDVKRVLELIGDLDRVRCRLCGGCEMRTGFCSTRALNWVAGAGAGASAIRILRNC